MSGIPQANSQAADFTLPDQMGARVKLSDFRGKNVVLAFYPADWSPVCTSELSLLQETLDQIHSYNAEVIGVSVDSVWSHRAWAEQTHIGFPLLSDFWPHGEVARRYGVFRDDDGITNRALFFIDESGVIRSSWVAKDTAIAPGLNVIFNALRQINPSAREPHHV
jgi:peroxiredoxin